jgi:TolA-binding protein
MVYPYLSQQAPEQRVEVKPAQSIPEADALYSRALKIHDEVRLIPLAGALPQNKEKARQALALFKKLLKDYPTSDKVDDAAFFCGEIY